MSLGKMRRQNSVSTLEALEAQSMRWNSLEEYCMHHEGNRVISRILIANNGIAAVKCMSSMRKWEFAELGIQKALCFICMATPEDLAANAEFIRLADEVVEVPGGPNNNNYANVELIVDLAQRKQVDAVWAGWGHASENPLLPEKLSRDKRGIVFLGPGAKAMHALGDKIGSSIIAQSADVPCIAWSGSDVDIQGLLRQGSCDIPESTYQQACVRTPEEALAKGDQVGYPLMVKASEGGGGKGIRKVNSREELPDALAQVQAEVVGSPVFLMKLFSGGRHLEVQVLADQHGNVTTLNGRDCSVQRRHQKIIEEGPPVVAHETTFAMMEKAAASLAKAVGYVGVGTVEYLYRDGEFYFLEMNPRLQVEHTVTELICDVNLPLAMLLVGMGIPLHRIPDLRTLFDRPDRHGSSLIDFDNEIRQDPRCHVIAARITAENPDAGFRPTSGRIQEVKFRVSPHVWGYFSVYGQGSVHEFADSQFGHIFSSGGTRESARKHLISALSNLAIYGKIRTTTQYLIKLLQEPEYRDNEISTQWLDGLIATKKINTTVPEGPERFITIVCGAVVKAIGDIKKLQTEAVTALDYGRMPPSSLLCTKFPVELIVENVKYCINVTCTDYNLFALELNNSYVKADTRPLSDGRMLVFTNGKTYTVFFDEDNTGLRLEIDGRTVIFEEENDPSKLRASTTGKLCRFLVPDGGQVAEGAPFAEMEVMKMYMQLKAASSGVIRHRANAESYVKAGDIIADLELDDPTQQTAAEVFTGKFPDFAHPHLPGRRSHQKLRESLKRAEAIMNGFHDPSVSPDNAELASTVVSGLINALRDPLLPYFEVQEAFTAVKAALPKEVLEDVENTMSTEIDPHTQSPAMQPSPSHPVPTIATDGTANSLNREHSATTMPNPEVVACCTKILQKLLPYEADSRLANLIAVLRKHSDGQSAVIWGTLTKLLQEYAQIEKEFSGKLDRREEAIRDMVQKATVDAKSHQGLDAREQRQLACRNVYDAMVSNEGIEAKSNLVINIINVLLTDPSFHHVNAAIIEQGQGKKMHKQFITPIGCIRALGNLRGQPYSKVVLEARQLLVRLQTPSLQNRQAVLFQRMQDEVKQWQCSSDTEVVKGYRNFGHYLGPLVQSVHSLFEELSVFLTPAHTIELRFASLELFIRRSHRQYAISALYLFEESKEPGNEVICAEFWFQRQPLSRSEIDSRLGNAYSDEDLSRASNNSSGSGQNSPMSSPMQRPLPAVKKKRGYKRSDSSAFGSSFGGSFTDSISDIQEFVQAYENGACIQEPEYPKRYNLIMVFYSMDTAESRFCELLKTHFRPEQCSQNGLQPSSTRTGPVANDEEPTTASPMASNRDSTKGDSVHVLNILLSVSDMKDQVILERIRALVQSHKALLYSLNISRLTLVTVRPVGYPLFFTFRAASDYEEDLIYRNINPPRAFMIEIGRLGVFYDIKPVADGPILNRHVRTFLATQKRDKNFKKPVAGADLSTRFFVRALVLGRAMVDPEDSKSFITNEVESMLLECCESLALSKGFVEKQTGRAVAYNSFGTLQMCNHLFLAILPHLYLNRDEAIELLQQTISKNSNRLRQVGVIEVEVPLTVLEPMMDDNFSLDENSAVSSESATFDPANTVPTRLRVVFSNPSGHRVQQNAYIEIFTSGTNMAKGGNYVFKSLNVDGKGKGPWEGKDVNTPYPPMDELEVRRLVAKGKETTYCYDFLTLFESVVSAQWDAYQNQQEGNASVSQWIARQFTTRKMAISPPAEPFQSIEMILDASGSTLNPIRRPPGQNDIGMVCWRVSMLTPECPKGREFILIANDVTVQNGSFGVKEDMLFHRATELAMKEGLPRIFVAANAGARIGLVDEVKSQFRVQWRDPLNPSSGMEFLYLDETTVDVLKKKGMAQTEQVSLGDGTKRHKLNAVIGPDGIGVENLRGSGTIAGSTCRAYDDIFTLTFVSGTSVGIGAYLVRLGQRAIQKGPPILLTGEAALNKVLGKKVYASNYQLGGTHIMYNNGVSHEVVSDDMMGVEAIVKWLSYVPSKKGAPLPILRTLKQKMVDSIDRKVYDPRRGPKPEKIYDPRVLLTGAVDAIGKWRGGLFDKDSFRETLAGWGMTTICGRARLGGIPVGVILPEMRTVTCTHPADPADPESMEKTVSQAGLVWFPDSAYKTGSAIKDFNREGLPLFVIANWRGFSGGMRDMYEQILKFGSMIVEGLVEYKQPVFVYIPPDGELRGGAWVVIDPTINSEQMEMYVDPTARGGILEPAGIVEIKYRRNQLLETMARLDPEVAALKMQLSSASESERQGIAAQLKERQELLLPLYQKVAEHYADLHDVPARMQSKGCIHGVVEWRLSRQFFYGRLRRRLAEQSFLKKMQDADPAGDKTAHKAAMQDAVRSQVKDRRPRMPSLGSDDPQDSTSFGNGEKEVMATVERDHKIADALEGGGSENDSLKALLTGLKKKTVTENIAKLTSQDGEAALDGFALAVQHLPLDKRDEMLQSLMARLSQSWAKEGATP